MQWSEFVAWTDTTAKPEGDVWESLRAGLIEECHRALCTYHLSKNFEWNAKRRLISEGPPGEYQLEMRRRLAGRQREELVYHVGMACWYAARVSRVSRGMQWSPYLSCGGVTRLMQRLEATTMAGTTGRIDWAVSTLGMLLSAVGVNLAEALANNIAKLTARKAAGTIQGEGER